MKTILLIDDDETILSIFGMVLQHKGYRVLQASSGEAGIELAAKELPDLILTDMTMEGGGGRAVLKYIREHAALKARPVVIMTGYSDAGVPRLSSDPSGADEILTKPVGLDVLFECISGLLK